jgi:hypothetical protein
MGKARFVYGTYEAKAEGEASGEKVKSGEKLMDKLPTAETFRCILF